MSPALQTKQLGNLSAPGKEIQLEIAKAAGGMAVTVDLDTDCAQLVLDVGALTLGEKNRNKMKSRHLRKRENENISRAVCALLNSGGGVIKVQIENEDYNLTRDGLGLDLEASLCKCLPFVNWHLDITEDGGYVYIFVKSWSLDVFGLPIGTLRTNLYTRSTSSSVEVNAAAALEFLQDLKETGGRSCGGPELPAHRVCPGVEEESHVEDLAAAVFNKTQFQHQEDFPFSRSTFVEVTLLSGKQLQKRIKELIPRHVSAFANTDGGYLFIGLDGNEQQIIGFEAERSDLEHLENEIDKCIQQLPVTHFCEEQEKIKYTCKFIPVHRPGAVCSYVCALRVERFCCAVFSAEPDSWHVEDSCVKRFTTEEWVKLQMDTPPGFSRRKDKWTLQSSIPPLRPWSWCADDIPGIQQQSDHLPVGSRKVTCSPEALFMEFFSEHERYEELLHREVGSLHQGTLVVSKSWALGIDLPEKQEVILDVLHMSQDSLLTLHSFIRGDEELEGDSTVLTDLGAKLKNYCKQTALTLKQMLVNLGGYTGNIGFAIKITYLGHRAVSLYDSSSIISYPRNYYLTTKTARDLVKALAQDLGAAYQGKTVLISLPLKF